MDYDRAYEQIPDYFGSEPEAFFTEHCRLLRPGSRVLDIGAGQGRHSLYLARRDVQVTAIDPSSVAIQTLERLARAEHLPLKAVQTGFTEFEPDTVFDGVLLFGILQEQPWPGILALLKQIHRWTRAGGLLFVTAFTTDDPACQEATQNGQTNLGENSFQLPSGDVRTYLEPGQLQELLPGFEATHWWEGLGPFHRHGDNPPERHGRVEAVLYRQDP